MRQLRRRRRGRWYAAVCLALFGIIATRSRCARLRRGDGVRAGRLRGDGLPPRRRCRGQRRSGRAARLPRAAERRERRARGGQRVRAGGHGRLVRRVVRARMRGRGAYYASCTCVRVCTHARTHAHPKQLRCCFVCLFWDCGRSSSSSSSSRLFCGSAIRPRGRRASFHTFE